MKNPKYRCMLLVCIISLLLVACSGEGITSTLEQTTEALGNESAESAVGQAAETIEKDALESDGKQAPESAREIGGEKTVPENVSDLSEESDVPAVSDAAYSPELCADIAASLSYTGEPVAVVNGNIPFFGQADYTTDAFETYSDLDALKRCGAAYANVGTEIMPTEERGSIGSVKPTGWHTVKYNDIIEGNYLYNRCHLIAYELAGENANEKNLITGTRYMNVQGMLPYENKVAGYVKETGNHVLYRVTPVFEGDNLVASGVVMEAFSVEDSGQGICFNIYAFNVQPGIEIDYATGESQVARAGTTAVDVGASDADESGALRSADTSAASRTGDVSVADESSASLSARGTSDTGVQSPAKPDAEKSGTTKAAEESGVPKATEKSGTSQDAAETAQPQQTEYILNTNTHKFHYPYCSSVDDMKEKNKQSYTGSRDDVINMGYEPCKRCNP